MPSPTLLSFFAGIGGFDLGFERAGFHTVQQVEIDQRCRAVLTRHFPHADRSIPDVRFAARDTLRHADVWTGGFPCQDLSVAGNRKGLAGSRSGLYFEFQRAYADCRPGWTILENVPGLLSSNAGLDFALVLGGLSGVVPAVPAGGWGNAGLVRGPVYHVAYRVLDARYFGVPQRRRRVFIVAGPRDGRVAEVLFEPGSLYRDLAESEKAGQDAAAAAARGAAEAGAGDEGQLVFGRNNTSGPIDDTGSLTAHPTGRYDFESDSFVLGRAIDERNSRFQDEGVSGTLQGKKSGGYSLAYQNPILAFPAGQGGKARSMPVDEDVSPPLKSESSGNNQVPTVAYGLSHQLGVSSDDEPMPTLDAHNGGKGVPGVIFQQNQRDEVRYIDGDGQTAGSLSAEPGMKNTNYVAAFTERTRSDGRNLEMSEDLAYALTDMSGGGNPRSGRVQAGPILRRLTPREAERLMGFPDDWTEWGAGGFQSDSARYRQLGNAVVVPVAEWIARRLLAVMLNT